MNRYRTILQPYSDMDLLTEFTGCDTESNDNPDWVEEIDNWLAQFCKYKQIDTFVSPCSFAELIGRLEMYGELVTNEDEANRIMDNIVQYGQLDLLTYMHQTKGFVLDGDLVGYSVYFGHVNCLRYLHEHGCLLSSVGLDVMATGANSVDCLRYLHENGVPLTEHIYHESIHGNYQSFECCRYAFERGCLLSKPIKICIYEHTDLELVDYMVKHNLGTVIRKPS